MAQPKLFRVLATFGKGDWIQCNKFIIAHNRADSESVPLFAILREKRDSLHHMETIDEIWEYFTHHNRKSFMNLMSRLYQDVTDWMGFNAMQKSKWENDIWKLKSFNDRGLYAEANSVYENILEELEDYPFKGPNIQEKLSKIIHIQTYTDNPYKNTIGEVQYKKLVTYSLSTLIEKLQLYLIELKNMSRIKNYEFTDEIKKIKDLLSLNINTPNQETINHLQKLVVENDTQYYFDLADKLKSDTFEPESEFHTLITLYLLSKGLTLQIQRNGSLSYITDLYNYALKTGALMTQGKIPEVRFYNMVTSLSKFESIENVNQIIHTWGGKVEAYHIESSINLAQAINYFLHEKYVEMFSYTQKVISGATRTKNRALCLEMIALYHDRNENLNSCIRHIENYKRFLKRNKSKLTKRAVTGMKNQIDVVEKLIKKDTNSKIKIDLSDYEYVFYKTWTVRELKRRKLM